MRLTATPNAATHYDYNLSRRLGVLIKDGIALGIHTLTPTQARRLDLVGARVRQSDKGLRIDLGHFVGGCASAHRCDLGTRDVRIRYPRGYGAPSLFVKWLGFA